MAQATHEELYKKHRPKKLSEIVGQDRAVAEIRKKLTTGKFPHAVLLKGPTGTGKTTIMRILRRILKCGDRDYTEINTADFKGIDTIRTLRDTLHLQPWSETKVIGIDECHKLTNDAQNAILKMLEDTPAHAYFILGTTDSEKLLKAVLGRCTEIKLQAIEEQHLEALIKRVAETEGLSVSDEVVMEIAEAAEGSARKALVILEAVGAAEGDAEQKKAISITTVDKDLSYKLASALMGFGGAPNWNAVAQILQKMKDEDAEAVRYMVLAFARSCLVGKEGKLPQQRNLGQAAKVINFFGTHFYDSKQAGLAFACFNVVHTK